MEKETAETRKSKQNENEECDMCISSIHICGALKHARHLKEEIAVNENKCVRCKSTTQYALCVLRSEKKNALHIHIIIIVAAYNCMVLTRDSNNNKKKLDLENVNE